MSRDQLPELPTWTYPEVRMYYGAEEANKKLQEMEQQFNRNRIRVKSYAEAAEGLIWEYKARVEALLCLVDSKDVRIKELEEMIQMHIDISNTLT